MKFRVFRTSADNQHAAKPCEGAFSEQEPSCHPLAVEGEMEISWFIEIETLEALMTFLHSLGKVDWQGRPLGARIVLYSLEDTIEIYDDYRE